MIKKIILTLAVVYILIGLFITWRLDPTVRGGFSEGVQSTLGWPLIFLYPIH